MNDTGTTGPVYIAALMDRLEEWGDDPVLRHQGQDTTAAALRAA